MKTELIEKAYAIARERYAGIGVDTEKALAALQNISLSLHCWQADDVTGFENRGGDLTGGIQATGNYPGKARNIEELRADILKAKSFIPGTHRLNLHEIYGEFGGETVDRDQVEPRHFQGWIEWAKEHGMKLDFNSTSFSHPKSGDLSLANPDPGIRDFWVEHTKRCRAIAEEMGKAQGDPSIMNLWVHDGSKDLTVNRMLYRELLRDSLDRIFETEYDHMKDCIESKVFGSVWGAAKSRWLWLGVNLCTAFFASRVISAFDGTIERVVALAALMPIVAGMAGNSGNQTLTLLVRSLATGQVTLANTIDIWKKELAVAVVNGLLWGAIAGLCAWALYWDSPQGHTLGLVMALAMFLNIVQGAAVGLAVPLILNKMGRDPAMGGSVLLTFTTDSGGFLIFLGLATIFFR